MRNKTIWIVTIPAVLLSMMPAAAATLTAYTNTPGLADTAGSVAGNTTSSAPGFGSSSWQATGVKSNYYVTPQELFGYGVTVADVASMSYWTNQLNYSGDSNWSLYIYTVPTASDNSAGWYKSRLVASPGAGAAGWDNWTTAGLTFSDPSRNNTTYTTSITWGNITSGPVTWPSSGTTRDYRTETVKFFSIQTDSQFAGFTGLVDGLQVTLNNADTGSVNFEAAPEPATLGLTAFVLLGGFALLRGAKARFPKFR